MANVTSADVLSRFKSTITNPINSSIAFYKANAPAIASGSAAKYSLKPKTSSGYLSNGYQINEVNSMNPGVYATASVLRSQLLSMMQKYGAVRHVTYRQFKQSNSFSYDWSEKQEAASNSSEVFEKNIETGYSNLLTSKYIPEPEAGTLVVNGVVATASVNDYIARLMANWRQVTSSTEYIDLAYCHSSCHNNCHKSRNRR